MRNPRVHELREIFKARIQALRDHELNACNYTLVYTSKTRRVMDKRIRSSSMGELWRWCRLSVEWRPTRAALGVVYDDDLYALEKAAYLAGIDYYDAKKPGLKQRLMLKRLRG